MQPAADSGVEGRREEDEIHAVISDALLSARLPPGAALREVALAEVFGVSRERVRKVLQRLGNEKLLDLIPNRGAFVAAPTLEQAREIYEARRILEGGIVGHLAGMPEASAVRALRAHLAREAAAAEAGDRAESIRLSGEFHRLLARATGSAIILSEMQHLVSRTAMLVALFEPARAIRCACEEHTEITDALLAGDAPAAMKAMHRHLALIETRLRPVREPVTGDPIDVLRTQWGARRRTGDATASAGARAGPRRGTAIRPGSA